MTNKVTKARLAEIKQNKEGVKEFSNGEITVFWEPELCIHSANCLLGLPEVFNSKKNPWINIHASTSKEIMRIVDTCPSRSLTYLKSTKFIISKKRKTLNKKPKYARIKLVKNGPALITGNYILRGSDRKKIKTDNAMISICCCGASHKKPFCDGSHQPVKSAD
ncbi:MAG: (4Fe-4S)-binding protein [Bacteroidales bacterium]|nr:(4Fe-4S)-binding protein [Bacteroidales bacterium]MDD4604069.1 (4Fe-4S)-binding protein [Bacteroidales bacterium]